MDSNLPNFSAVEDFIGEETKLVNKEINDNHGWKTVTYQKRSRKQQPKKPDDFSEGWNNESGNVFGEIEQHSEDRRRRAAEAQRAAAAVVNSSSTKEEEGEDEGSDTSAAGVENGGAEVKQRKPKKPKKPKVTVAEAAGKIDPSDLAASLADATALYESEPEIKLMRFADYFGRAFASVNASQFPWMKILKESSVSKMVDIPLSHISEDVYKTSVEWLNHQPVEALGSSVLWSLDGILADLAFHQGAVKGSKKVAQQMPSKSQVAIFVVLAMMLRRKPDVLISLLPTMKDNPKYEGQDKLSIIVWLITQAYQGDLAVGLFMWIRLLLPTVSSKNCNPQSRDVILQLVERILSSPKAHGILLNGAVRKGERLVPPPGLELLMRATFPGTRVKATERFEAVYPVLKDVSLVVSPGSKAVKQVTQQIMQFAFKAAGEGNSALSAEASDIILWCLTQNPDSYKQWEKIYLDNLEGSIIVLRKLSDELKTHSTKHSNLDRLKVALKSFSDKNAKALASENDVARQSNLKDAEKQCKMILGRLSWGNGCMKSVVFLTLAVAIGAVFMSNDVQSWDMKKLLVDFNLC